MKTLRRFTKPGIEMFMHRLESSKNTPSMNFDDLCDDRALTQTLSDAEVVPDTGFHTRREAAETIVEVLRSAGVAHSTAIHDVGLWVWMSAIWIDSLAPVRSDGTRTPGARYRWVPAVTSWNTYHRHLLLGPYSIYHRYAANPDAAMCVLGSAVHAPGDMVEQLASNAQLITNGQVIELATRLYWDPGARRFKPGAAGKKPGSVRRLVAVLNQFDRTWDFHGTPADTMLELLPQEFGPFRRATASGA